MIEQPARSCHHDIDSGKESLGLRLDSDSAENRNNAQVSVLAVFPEAFFHLRRELPRRSQDQDANAMNRLPVFGGERCADQIVNDRKGEAGRFPVPVRETNEIRPAKARESLAAGSAWDGCTRRREPRGELLVRDLARRKTIPPLCFLRSSDF